MGLSESGVRLVAENAGPFHREIDRAEKAVNSFGDRAGSAGAGGLDRMSVATVALGTALGDLAVRGLSAATNALTNFLTAGFDFNKTLENASAQLKVFLGSQEAANEALAIAERRAARTPFAFEDYARSLGGIAAIQKQNGGELEDYLDLVERLAAANPAEGFEGATFALREAMSGDFLSLQDRFNIPKSVIAGLRETGVTVETLDAALAGLGYTTELVTGLAGTFDGRWSTLMDTVGRAGKVFMAPIFESLSMGLEGLLTSLDTSMPEIEAKLAGAGQFVADAITSFRQGWEGNWVDSDIIQPAHRVAGVFGTNVRRAVEDAQLAFDNFNTTITTLKETWEGSKLVSNWESLNRAGDEWNELMTSGQQLWDSLVGAADALGFELGEASTASGELYSWGGLLEIALAGIRKVVDLATIGINLATIGMYMFRTGIDVVLAGWRLLRAELSKPIPVASLPGIEAPWESGPPKNSGGVSSAPIQGGGGGGITNNKASISVNVNVPPGTPPTVAAGYVSDGLTQALRARGMA